MGTFATTTSLQTLLPGITFDTATTSLYSLCITWAESFIRGKLSREENNWIIRSVIAMKAREWSGDEKMREYLRPVTLFNATKFAQYQGQLTQEAEDAGLS